MSELPKRIQVWRSGVIGHWGECVDDLSPDSERRVYLPASELEEAKKLLAQINKELKLFGILKVQTQGSLTAFLEGK